LKGFAPSPTGARKLQDDGPIFSGGFMSSAMQLVLFLEYGNLKWLLLTQRR
jgi:hypothetical protein